MLRLQRDWYTKTKEEYKIDLNLDGTVKKNENIAN